MSVRTMIRQVFPLSHRAGRLYPGALLAVTAALCLPPAIATEAPSFAEPYRAEYQAKASGLSATAFRTLEQLEGPRYRLSNSLSLTVLGAQIGSVTETSDFLVQDEGLRPLNYSYVQTGPGRGQETVDFDWDAQLATAVEDGDSQQLSLQPGVMDKLSFTAQLSRDLAALPESERTAGRQFSYRLVDGDEVEEHLYAIAGEDIVDTPLGALPTLRLERVRGSDSRRRTTFWLWPERDFLLVKFEQVSSSGSATELLLQSVAAPQ